MPDTEQVVLSIAEVLSALQNKRFAVGDVLRCNLFSVEVITENTFLITFPSGKIEKWKFTT
jgi:phage pi2 protein 07